MGHQNPGSIAVATASALIAPLWVILSCADPDGTHSVMAGDTLVVHSAEPVFRAGSLREVLRVGSLDGADEYVFSDIRLFTVGPTGEIYISELGGSLRRFDADGRFARTVARDGGGPGEVNALVGMAVSHEGHLAVMDLGNRRLSVWSSEGALLREISMPGTRPRYGRDAVAFDQDGEIWVGLDQPVSHAGAGHADGRPVFARITADGQLRDTVFIPERASHGCEPRDPRYGGGWWEDKREPFIPMVKWTRGVDGTFAFGCPDRYQFVAARTDGRVMRVSRSWERPRTGSDEQSFYSSEVGLGRIPDTKPAFHRLWVSEDGATWVWPARPGVIHDTPWLVDIGGPASVWRYFSPTDGFDVFDRDGRWLGHVETPANWGVHPYPGIGDPFMRGDTVWAVIRGEWDEALVARFVVEWKH